MGRPSNLQAHLPALREGVALGKTPEQIALGLPEPVKLVRKWIRQLGLKAKRPKHWRKIDLSADEIQQKLNSGLTQAQAAIVLGASVNTIERRVRSMGLDTARSGPRLGTGHKFCWTGGRRLDKHGYVLIYAPMHPAANSSNGCVSEHRLMMEVTLGRYLDGKEVVHHIDDHPRHNWPSNLGLFASNADHLRHELTGRVKATPRTSTPGAYGCNQTIDRCPDEHETLGQTPLEIRRQLAHHIAAHCPTTEQQRLAFREVLRSGPHLDPFQPVSTG